MRLHLQCGLLSLPYKSNHLSPTPALLQARKNQILLLLCLCLLLPPLLLPKKEKTELTLVQTFTSSCSYSNEQEEADLPALGWKVVVVWEGVGEVRGSSVATPHLSSDSTYLR